MTNPDLEILHVDRRVLTGLLLPLALLTTTVAAQPQAELRLSIVDTLQMTQGDLRGLAWIGNDTTLILVADPDTLNPGVDLSVTLVWLGADGGILQEHDVTGTLTHGLAYDGKWLWSFGPTHGNQEAQLYKIEADSLFVDAAYPTPGHRPSDLAWDGTHLWMVDRDRGRLDRFDPETEDVTRSRTTPAFSPTGLAFDERFFWVTDLATGRLDRLSRGGSVWSGTTTSDTYFRRGEDVMLAWNRGMLWIIPDHGGWVIRARVD